MASFSVPQHHSVTLANNVAPQLCDEHKALGVVPRFSYIVGDLDALFRFVLALQQPNHALGNLVLHDTQWPTA